MNPARLFHQEPDPLCLAPGEALFREGEIGNQMFVLLEGTIEIRVSDKVVETASLGAFLGERWRSSTTPRARRRRLRSAPAGFAKVDLRRFHFLIQQNPFFATHVMKELVARLRYMNQMFAKQPA